MSASPCWAAVGVEAAAAFNLGSKQHSNVRWQLGRLQESAGEQTLISWSSPATLRGVGGPRYTMLVAPVRVGRHCLAVLENGLVVARAARCDKQPGNCQIMEHTCSEQRSMWYSKKGPTYTLAIEHVTQPSVELGPITGSQCRLQHPSNSSCGDPNHEDNFTICCYCQPHPSAANFCHYSPETVVVGSYRQSSSAAAASSGHSNTHPCISTVQL